MKNFDDVKPSDLTPEQQQRRAEFLESFDCYNDKNTLDWLEDELTGAYRFLSDTGSWQTMYTTTHGSSVREHWKNCNESEVLNSCLKLVTFQLKGLAESEHTCRELSLEVQWTLVRDYLRRAATMAYCKDFVKFLESRL